MIHVKRMIASTSVTLVQIGSLLLLTFFVSYNTAAEETQPAPQFLYRSEDRLILVDGYTGEETPLNFPVEERDRFSWSPDGRYLVALVNEDFGRYCFNLYDVDSQVWLYDEPISCEVTSVLFAPDGASIVYAASDQVNGSVWLYNLTDETTQLLHQTSDGVVNRQQGISQLRWSSTAKYLTFVDYIWIMGGTINVLQVVNMQNPQEIIRVGAPDPYYASYDPIWSADDAWFLLVLKEEYVRSGSAPYSNHRGDLYLVNSTTGSQHRLTYTPALSKLNIHWTEDGNIAFSVLMTQYIEFTTEQAINIEAVPANEIVMPPPTEVEYDTYGMSETLISPDPYVAAWVHVGKTSDQSRSHELRIGQTFSRSPVISVPLPQNYQYTNILIGWRPSDYPYLQG